MPVAPTSGVWKKFPNARLRAGIDPHCRGGEMELIACARKTAEAHSFKAMVTFKWAKRISTRLRSLRDALADAPDLVHLHEDRARFVAQACWDSTAS